MNDDGPAASNARYAGVLGKHDPRSIQPDSLFPVFSVTRGVTAGMVHLLADKGYV
ncbi:putative beta-lactamase/transpeptidase [Helianthus anomalus]